MLQILSPPPGETVSAKEIANQRIIIVSGRIDEMDCAGKQTDRPRLMKKVASNATHSSTPTATHARDAQNNGRTKKCKSVRKILNGSKEPACPMEHTTIVVLLVWCSL